jgi:hypothetical protein
MKKFKTSIFILSALFLFVVVSCHKDEHEEISATISFVEPSITDTLAFNEELHAEGTIVGSAELHGYTLSMTNITTNEELFSATASNHSPSYAFHEHWVNNVSDTSIIRINVIVILDHEGNTETKTIDLVALPL